MEWMKNAIAKKLWLLGEQAEIVRQEGTVQVTAIIMPVSSLSQAARTALSQPDGIFPPGSYEYIGPPEQEIGSCRYVVSGGKRYYVRRSEIYRVGGKGIFCWGLMLGGGDDEAEG